MLAPRYVLFTALEDVLIDSGSRPGAATEEAFEELARRNVLVVLSGAGTRVQMEVLRRKLDHSQPFISENGGGLFLPDGYFALHIEGAQRAGRYFCVPFGRDYTSACAALEEIAADSGAEVEGYSEMTPREIARNTGLAPRDAELAKQREFSERFFFAGDTEASEPRFSEIARERGWQATPPGDRGDLFWELSNGKDAGRAVKTLMNLYRKSLRLRLSSIGIGNSVEHLPLLAAVDHPVLLPQRGEGFDAAVQDRLSHLRLGEAAGPTGWNQAVLEFLEQNYDAGKSGI